MIGNLPYKTKQIFFVLIKLSIVTGAFYFIYQKLDKNENLQFDVFIDFLSKNHVFSSKNILLLIILTVFNWFLEILKWQTLVSVLQKISYLNALKQSFASLTASLITPNRVGDYAAKVAYYPKTLRKRILLLNLMSNMYQMGATLTFGCIGFALFVNNYQVDISYFKLTQLFALVLIIGTFGFLGIRHKKYKLRGFQLTKICDFIKTIPLKIHIKSALLSVLRYILFSFQFYMLLQIFGIEVSYTNAMIVITSMYFLSSIIPSIFIFDVVIKGSVAIYLFGIVGVNELTILSIITIMWLLNFVLPSIIGSFYILGFKFNQPVIKPN